MCSVLYFMSCTFSHVERVVSMLRIFHTQVQNWYQVYGHTQMNQSSHLSWVRLSTSTWLQQVDFFTSKSLTATISHLQWAVSFASFCKRDPVHLTVIKQLQTTLINYTDSFSRGTNAFSLLKANKMGDKYSTFSLNWHKPVDGLIIGWI